MPIPTRTVRLLALVSAGVFLAVALALRAAFDGPVEQHSGTALYASMVYAGAYLLRPRLSPLAAGAGAVAFCWAVECAQLTGVPAYLSAHSLLARLALGVAFDPLDLVWYPAGVIPLVAVHLLLRARASRTALRRAPSTTHSVKKVPFLSGGAADGRSGDGTPAATGPEPEVRPG